MVASVCRKIFLTKGNEGSEQFRIFNNEDLRDIHWWGCKELHANLLRNDHLDNRVERRLDKFKMDFGWQRCVTAHCTIRPDAVIIPVKWGIPCDALVYTAWVLSRRVTHGCYKGRRVASYVWSSSRVHYFIASADFHQGDWNVSVLKQIETYFQFAIGRIFILENWHLRFCDRPSVGPT
jgi:hypothetical protein